ncbi:spore coat U domain-containing protein [Amylibacter sp.]|nr:spore coat U domain-containing protein [Amylibacter sp.]MDB9727305.1 spore coat U domain-containing protein [Amylibacter sp.]MDC1409410.1 spore coat U domain-containing protein [Amylibacter sp.]
MKTCISSKFCLHQTFKKVCASGIINLVHISKRNWLIPWVITIIFLFIGQQGHACMINITGVNFGSYDVFSNAASDSTGNIDVNCPSGVGYTIGLSAGNGTYEQRGMISGTHTLNYNLYTAANREFVWEDATTSGATVSGSGTGININHVVYGRIPPRQNVRAGSYSDTVNLIITF